MDRMSPQDYPHPVNLGDNVNRHYLWLLGLLSPLAASACSIMLGAAIFWVVVHYFLGNLRFSLPRIHLPMAMAAMLYMGTLAFATSLAISGLDLARQLIVLLPFSAVVIVPPSCRQSPLAVNFKYLTDGAATGLYLSVILSAIEFFGFRHVLPHGGRVSLLSGNPVPAAYAIIVFMMIAALGIDRLSARQQFFRIGALFAGLISMIATGSISVLMSLPFVLCVFVWRYRLLATQISGAFGKSRSTGILLLVASMLLIAGVLAWSPLMQRAESYVRVLYTDSHSPEAASLRQREAMWKAAYAAAVESPWAGYGIQNRFAAITPYLPAEFKARLQYSHPHNGFLAAAVAGGVPALAATILLLLSPVIVAMRHGRGIWRDDLIALTLGTAIVYSIAGMVGVMYFHDATDAIFCWVMVFAAVFAAPQQKVARNATHVANNAKYS
jgi:O-antigen ligase